MTAALVLGFWSSAGAALPKARFEYSRGPGAEECPDARVVTEAVAARLGYDPFDTSAGETMRARIERGPEQFLAVLALVDQAGAIRAERRLESNRGCAELVSAMALSMSIVIDPERAAEGARVSASPEPPNAVPPELVKPKASEATAVRRERAAPRQSAVPDEGSSPALAEERRQTALLLRVTGGPHLAFGVGPGTAVGASISVGARLGRWSLSIGGRYDAATGRDVSPDGHIEADLLGATLAPCVHQGLLVACLVGLLGGMNAKSTDITEHGSDSELFAAVGLRLAIEQPISAGVALMASADLLAALRPLSVRINDAAVWETPRVSAALSTGLSVEF